VAAAAQPNLDPAALLAARGIRSTRQRLRVLSALASERDDATAQEIHERLRRQGDSIGLATVYRTVALLSEQGVIDALSHRPGEICYRLCSEGHHHHLVCTGCHRVVELGDCDLGARLDELGAAQGFAVTAHSLELTGVCADCSTA
jgi:Fur family ferric uptake transcriptional regulator